MSLTPRCANNVYDSMGYLTMDFTCGAAACQSDRDCNLVRCRHGGTPATTTFGPSCLHPLLH